MTPEDRAIQLIEKIERAPREVGPVSLAPQYLRAVEWMESLPQNQSGADKSWVPRRLTQSRDHYARAVWQR